MRHQSFVDGRICMKRDANYNCGVGSRVIYDDLTVVKSGCLTHITLSTGGFPVTSTLSPQQCTMHTEYTQPWELTCIFV